MGKKSSAKKVVSRHNRPYLKELDLELFQSYMDSSPLVRVPKKLNIAVIKNRFRAADAVQRDLPFFAKREFGDEQEYGHLGGLNEVIGSFYESMITGLFGGDHVATRNLSVEGIDDPFQPDNIDSKLGAIREIKSISWRSQLNLTVYQFHKYLLQQGANPYIDFNKIYFAICLYLVRRPNAYFKQFNDKPFEKVIDVLTENTGLVAVLPFSVMFEMYNPKNQFSGSGIYRGRKCEHYSALSYSVFLNLLQNPEASLLSYGLSPDDYNIRKTRLGARVNVNGRRFRDFPMLVVDDKDHDEWIARFRAENMLLIDTINENYRSQRKQDLNGYDTDELFVHPSKRTIYEPGKKPNDEVPF